jgi:single-stranded DNA-binding protein
MRGKAKFMITGLVGKVVEFDNATKVSIANSYPTKEKDDKGRPIYNSDWNTVTVFEKTTRAWISDNLAPGDLVDVEGRLRDSSYQKGADTVYTTDRIVDRLDLLVSTDQLGSKNNEDKQDEAA